MEEGPAVGHNSLHLAMHVPPSGDDDRLTPRRTDVPAQGSTSRVEILAGLLLIVSVCMFGGTVLRVPLADTFFFDLAPHPDGAEYFAGAMSLFRDGIFQLHYAGRTIPPRYPFGYSTLMVPLLYGGLEPIEAPFVVNQVMGLLILFGLFVALWRAGHVLAAGLSSLIVATLPAFVVYCRAPLSDLSAAAMILFAALCFYRFVRSHGVLAAVLGSFLLGVSTWFRVPNVLFIPMVAVSVWGGYPGSWRRKSVLTAVLYTVLLAGAAPLLLYNARHLGSPLQTGYAVWLPKNTTPTTAFRIHRMPMQAAFLWRMFKQDPRPFSRQRATDVEGAGIGSAFILLGVLATFAGARRPHFWVLALPVVFFLGVMSMWFLGVRFVLPAVLLAVPMIGVVTSEILQAAFHRRNWQACAAAAGVFALLAATVCGYPGKQGYLDLVGLWNIEKLKAPAVQYVLTRQLDGLGRADKRLILTDFSPAYVYALTSGDRIVSPLRPQRVFLPAWYPESERREQIAAALADGRQIYGMMGRDELSSIGGLCPEPPGYEWRPLVRHDRGGGVAVLVRRGS